MLCFYPQCLGNPLRSLQPAEVEIRSKGTNNIGKEKTFGGKLFKLRDKSLFIQYGLTPTTIEWTNGADLAPEFLYRIGK